MSPPGSDPTATLIHNERAKLRATALNGIAIASIAAGFITPLAALAFGVPGAVARDPSCVPRSPRCPGDRVRPTSAGGAAPGETRLMTAGEIFLPALGPAMALTAGLLIYGFGVYRSD